MKKDIVALITGGGRGIGAASSEAICARGARVVITSRSIAELNDVAGRLASRFGSDRVLAVPADVSVESQVQHVFTQALQHFGPVQILVNNAAIAETHDFVGQDVESWDRIMAVNVRGAFLCAREMFRQVSLAKVTGAIVNVSSLGGLRGTEKFRGLTAYTTSKFAITGLTEALAAEGREYGIRCNAVAPGAVDTEMLRRAAPHLKTKTTAEDVARTVAHLCDDDESRHLTGTVVEIWSNL